MAGLDALKELHQLQVAEDHLVDARSPTRGVQLPRPLAEKRQITLRREVTGELAAGNESFQRDDDRRKGGVA